MACFSAEVFILKQGSMNVSKKIKEKKKKVLNKKKFFYEETNVTLKTKRLHGKIFYLAEKYVSVIS